MRSGRVLVISNMYPTENSYLGIFVKIQIESLEKAGYSIKKVVKPGSGMFAYISYIIRAVFWSIFGNHDLVHAHFGFHGALFPAVFKRRPLVITFHGSDALVEPYRNKVYGIFQRYVIRKSDAIIAVSNQLKKALVANLGAREREIHVISCGVDSTVFYPKDKEASRRSLGIPQDAKMVFFAGKITFLKGLDVIIACAEKMPDTQFYIAGAPDFHPTTDNQKYIGLVQNADMADWLSSADIYFLPSRSEGTPVSILEALACGVPVVSSDVGGCPDLVSDGETGYIIDVPNPLKQGQLPDKEMIYQYKVSDDIITEIVDKLSQILNNKNAANKMSKAGRETVESRYDNAIIADKIGDVFDAVK